MKLVSEIIQCYVDNNRCRDYTTRPGERSKAIYMPFSVTPFAQESYYFAQDEELNGENAIITAIDVLDNVTLGSTSNFGTNQFKDILTAGQMASAVLYISNNQRDVIATIPLVTMIRRLNDGKPCFTYFENQKWGSSYIEFADPSFSTSNGLQLQVWYNVRKK